MKPLLLQTAYWTLWAIVILWFWSGFRLARRHAGALRAAWKELAKGAVFAAACTAFVFATVPVGFKVFNDEVNLVSVSRTMAEQRAIFTCKGGFVENGKVRCVEKAIGKRSLLFPHFVHYLHLLRGYHASNANAANALFAFLNLWMIYAIGRYYFKSSLWAAVPVLLTLAQPVFLIAITSAGMETMNFFFILAIFAGIKIFLETRDEPSFRFLIMSLVAAAYLRYETAGFLPIVLLVLAAHGVLRPSHFRSVTCLLVPFLLVPIVLQRFITIPGQESAVIREVFGLSNFLTNHVYALKSLVHFDYQENNLLTIAGLAGLVLCIRRGAWDKVFVRTVSACLLFLWVLLLSFYAGRFDGAFGARIFIPHCILFSVFSAWLLHESLKRWKYAVYAVLLSSTALIGFYHGTAAVDGGLNKGWRKPDYEALRPFIAQTRSDKTFYIYEFPGQLLIDNLSSMDFGAAARHRDEIKRKLEIGEIEKIYALQTVRRKKISRSTSLHPAFKAVELAEVERKRKRKFRISEVTFA